MGMCSVEQICSTENTRIMKNIYIASVIALSSPAMCGGQWAQLVSGTTVEFDGVLIDNADTYWVTGENGTILKTTDGGANWSSQTMAGGGDLGSMIRLNEQTLLITADDGQVARSTNNGTNWQLVNTGAPNVLYDITAFGDHVWASGRDGGLVHSADQGQTWVAQSSGTAERLHGIHAFNANEVVAVGRSGVLLRTTNGGSTWQLNTIAGGEDLRGVLFVPVSIGLAAGPAGEILRSTDNGQTWNGVPLPSAMEAQALAAYGGTSVLAVGDAGAVFFSTDLGQNWQTMDAGVNVELSAVAARDGVAVAVGESGTIIKLSGGVGMADRAPGDGFAIYPNPSAGPVTFSWPDRANEAQEVTLEIFLADGRLVDSSLWPITKKQAHIQELAQGNYVVRLSSSTWQQQRRLVVLSR